MPNPANVLCPFDFSQDAARGLRVATSLASQWGAHLLVLYAVPTAREPDAATPPKDAAHRLDHFVETMAIAGQAITTSVVPGLTVPTILDVAERSTRDVIVMGTSGGGGIRRALASSVAVDVIRQAPCPVVCVPPTIPDVTSFDQGLSRIICAIDFSAESLAGLAYAAGLAGATGASLTMLHVVEGVEGSTLAPFTTLAEAARADDRAIATQRLADLVPPDTGRCSQVTTTVLDGRADRGILAMARESSAHVIVMGTHRRTKLGGLLMGSTVASVLQQASCLVLTVGEEMA